MKRRFEAFVISMINSDKRRDHVRKIVEDCSLPCLVINAVNGSTLCPEIKNSFCSDALHIPTYPFKLKSSEIGCFISHRIAWQMILDRDLDGALILEDDVELAQPEFGQSLSVAFDALNDLDHVRFRLMQRTNRLIRCKQYPSLTYPHVTSLGTQAQVVSSRGATKLLAASAHFDRPVDTFLQMHWISGIKSCEVSPSYVYDRTNELGGSTIQLKPSGFQPRLLRNILRTFYRFQIYWISLFKNLSL